MTRVFINESEMASNFFNGIKICSCTHTLVLLSCSLCSYNLEIFILIYTVVFDYMFLKKFSLKMAI